MVERTAVKYGHLPAWVAEGLTDVQIAARMALAGEDVTSLDVQNARLRLGLAHSRHEAELRRLAAEGLTRKQIAARLELHPDTIAKLSRSMGVEVAAARPGCRPGGSLLARHREEVVRLAEKGRTRAEIAAKFGVSPKTVGRFAKDNGIKIAQPAPVVPPPPAYLPQLRRLAAQGLSRAEIAQRLGLSFSAVNGAVRRHGIEVISVRPGPSEDLRYLPPEVRKLRAGPWPPCAPVFAASGLGGAVEEAAGAAMAAWARMENMFTTGGGL